MKKIKFSKRVKKTKTKPLSYDICLIVHGTVLLHTKHQNFVIQPEESLFELTATEVAEVARRLLPLATTRQRIALALPGEEFVATTLKLPMMDEQALRNAVHLQLPTLLPGATDPLLLAVQPGAEDEQICALWMPIKRAEELFKAFDKVGLFLAGILPRPLVALPATPTSCQIYDEDDNTITSLEWSGTAIRRWLHLPKTDCDSSEFKKQLEEALSTFSTDLEQERKTSVKDWEELSMPPPATYGYAFIPPGAVAQMAKAVRQKKRLRLSIAAGLLFAALLGGLYFAIDHEQRLKQRLTELKRRTVTVSQLRAEVGEIEEHLGPVKNFPRQNVVELLEKLNGMIPKDSWIVSFNIEGGAVKIEGYSPNPTRLIEVLTKDPSFYQVEQSRGTISERGKEELRFGINFKLKDFDLAAYWLEYFPNKR